MLIAALSQSIEDTSHTFLGTRWGLRKMGTQAATKGATMERMTGAQPHLGPRPTRKGSLALTCSDRAGPPPVLLALKGLRSRRPQTGGTGLSPAGKPRAPPRTPALKGGGVTGRRGPGAA